ncbi:response regulator transcription factor [Amycolatopsis thermalba]|uniref:response regulator transcription factor n=1 Tax=Amycolatopsis thermalba TaxID=944492 RepID=UPI000E260D97|nr:response regulator transcription factor [Amycolatopsis thermalba]
MTRSNDPTRVPQGPSAGRSVGVAAVDPVPIYREGLSGLVQRTPGMHWAGQAINPHGALQLAEQIHPDVILVDSGLDPHGHLSKLLIAGDPALIVIALVREANRTPAFLHDAIAAGVHAAIPRSAESRRLVEGIRRAYLDRRYVDPSLATLVSAARQSASAGAVRRAQMPLSRREYQVLQLVAEGLENAGIAKVLYLSVETVRTHVKSILRKLSARDRTHAVTIAFRAGILVAQPDDGPEQRLTPGSSAPGVVEYRSR